MYCPSHSVCFLRCWGALDLVCVLHCVFAFQPRYGGQFEYRNHFNVRYPVAPAANRVCIAFLTNTHIVNRYCTFIRWIRIGNWYCNLLLETYIATSYLKFISWFRIWSLYRDFVFEVSSVVSYKTFIWLIHIVAEKFW